MQVIVHAPTLLKKLGKYAHAATTDPELADKLLDMPGNDVDRIFMAMELLTTFRDRSGADGVELLGQLAAFSLEQRWSIPGKPERLEKLLNGAKRELGEPVDQLPEDDAEPVLAYREDGVDYRENAVIDVDTLRASMRKAINAIRDERQDGQAPTPFGPANSDADSRGKINGLVMMALLSKQANKPFEQGFTLADDSTVILDANMTIGLGVAVGTFISAVHAKARELKALINQADTVEELKAIDLTAGWPA